LRKTCLLTFLLLLSAASGQTPHRQGVHQHDARSTEERSSTQASNVKPRLIVAIIVDQFRYDYTTRFAARYTGGLHTMLEQGAVFLDAHQDHFPTVTAVGHATFLTGSTPATSGIIGNEWLDRTTGKTITSVEDQATHLVGAAPGAKGSSPHNLLVSTLGDEIKIADGGTTKVIGISMKDRAAILPSGHMADAAYWVDNATGNVVSSSFYQQALPEWVQQFNAEKPAQAALGKTWYPLGAEGKPGKAFMLLPGTADKQYFSKWEMTPYANDMLESFAEQVLIQDQMGHHQGTDLLTVSFSANDHLGHAVGPDDPAVEDMSVRTDATLGKLLAAAERAAGGRENLLVVMSADHGVAPKPEVMQLRKMPAGRASRAEFTKTINDALNARWGNGDWIMPTQEIGIYLNYDTVAAKKLQLPEVEQEAARAAATLPYIERVYTREQLLQHGAMADTIDNYVARGFYPSRSPDVFAIQKPYWLFGDGGTSHGTPYNYDSHVPLIFWGAGVKHEVYAEPVGISDVAPTLAALLRISTPTGSVGHILQQILPPTGGISKEDARRPAR
jgi:predicted AlkP superfamily pyrophosphatase or phosphodiesterase